MCVCVCLSFSLFPSPRRSECEVNEYSCGGRKGEKVPIKKDFVERKWARKRKRERRAKRTPPIEGKSGAVAFGLLGGWISVCVAVLHLLSKALFSFLLRGDLTGIHGYVASCMSIFIGLILGVRVREYLLPCSTKRGWTLLVVSCCCRRGRHDHQIHHSY